MSGIMREGSMTPSPQRRFERRQIEILETEDEACRNMQRLGFLLRERSDDAWASTPAHLLTSTHDTLRALREVHKEVRAQLAAARGFGPDPKGVAHLRRAFSPVMRARLVAWHSQYEERATQISAILQARQRPSSPQEPPVAAGAEQQERAALDLLLRPTQRLMKYPLFLEALADDARAMDRAGKPGAATLASELAEALAQAREIATEVNAAKRLREQHERVRELAQSVGDVPEGVRIARTRRRVLIEAGNVMQRGREGYRTLFVFNDALLVCKQGMRKVESSGSALQDLRFKDLISFRGISQRLCPSIIPPSAFLQPAGADDVASRGVDAHVADALIPERYGQALSMKERAFSFELRGRCFLGLLSALLPVCARTDFQMTDISSAWRTGPKSLITKLVGGIQEAVDELQACPRPRVPWETSPVGSQEAEQAEPVAEHERLVLFIV